MKFLKLNTQLHRMGLNYSVPYPRCLCICLFSMLISFSNGVKCWKWFRLVSLLCHILNATTEHSIFMLCICFCAHLLHAIQQTHTAQYIIPIHINFGNAFSCCKSDSVYVCMCVIFMEFLSRLHYKPLRSLGKSNCESNGCESNEHSDGIARKREEKGRMN